MLKPGNKPGGNLGEGNRPDLGKGARERKKPDLGKGPGGAQGKRPSQHAALEARSPISAKVRRTTAVGIKASDTTCGTTAVDHTRAEATGPSGGGHVAAIM